MQMFIASMPSSKFPVLLMRHPCFKSDRLYCVYAHPGRYATQGYSVVIHDVRNLGTFAAVKLFVR